MKKNLKLLFLIILFLTVTQKSIAQVSDSKIIINGISVNNIIKSALLKTDSGTYQIAKEEDFDITYVPKFNHQFMILIYNSPFQEKRQQAEQKLISLLGISAKDACWLYVTTAFNNPLSKEKIEGNFPLSFCNAQKSLDLNNDKAINTIDYALVTRKYGRLGKNITEDLNNDGVVNSLDLSIVLARLGEKAN